MENWGLIPHGKANKLSLKFSRAKPSACMLHWATLSMEEHLHPLLTLRLIVRMVKVVYLINDVVEAHCYVVNIGQTDREQIRSRINSN